MEVDEQQDQQASSQPKLELNLVPLIRTEQGQNGVKHGDYSRYRRHCKNKLRALYKALKFQHGRTKYIKRKIDVATVTDVRFLHILIFSAERAWAYAMELKKEIEGSMNLQKRRHLAARMRKAAGWARDLARIASVRCDPRGVVEAEAYAAFLSGSALVEKQAEWETALARLTRAKHIFTTLSSFGGTADQQALYLHQVEDMEAAIRFCTYQLKKKGVAEPSEAQLLAAAQQEESSLPAPQLQAHLSTLSAESAAALPAGGPVQADVAVNLTWLGRTIPVRSERLKTAVSHVHAVESQVKEAGAGMEVDGADGPGAAKQAAAYEKLIKALQEARTAARLAIKSSTAPEGDTAHAELEAAEAALGGMVASRQAELSELQARDLEDRFARSLDKARKDKAREPVAAEEVIRSLDQLSRALAQLGDLGAHSGGRAGEQLFYATQGKAACVRAARTYYAAHYLLAGGKPLEAYALFERAAQRAMDATDEAPDATYKSYCTKLIADGIRFMSVAHAEHASNVAGQREGVETGLGSLGLAEGGAPPTQWLMDALDSWESFAAAGKPPHVYQLPFTMQPIPCRPIMLDTAAAWVAYPSLDHRLRKAGGEKKSVLSSLGLGWAWGGKK